MNVIDKAMEMWRGKPDAPAPAPFPVSATLGSTAEWKYPAGFTVAINRVLSLEGGYTDGAGDPGGETNWGVSKRSYPKVDIKGLTRDAAIAIYFSDFWNAVSAEQMPPALAYQALDFAVNSSPQTAIRKLQTALGVADDGHWGPVTQAAAKAAPVPQTIMRYFAERLDYMRSLSNWSSAGKGWAGRIATDLRYGALDSSN